MALFTTPDLGEPRLEPEGLGGGGQPTPPYFNNQALLIIIDNVCPIHLGLPNLGVANDQSNRDLLLIYISSLDLIW